MNSITQNIWFIAAIWMGLTFVASILSIRLKVSVALIEILAGIVAGNFLGIHETAGWINFLAMAGSCIITFLAGIEVDPVSLRANLKPSMVIGVLSFLIPFAAVWAFAQLVMGWNMQQAQIAGIALSTASVAVVYAVMVETGQSDSSLGKMILAACFVTDFLTLFMLSALFANPGWWMVAFIAVTAVALFFLPRWMKLIISKMGASHQISEPEVKFLLLVLFFLGGMATTAKSEAVLPAYLMGVVLAGVFMHDKTLVHRLRSIAFAMFTPFYFIRAGLFVSLPAVWAAAGIIIFLFVVKLATKYMGVYPFARLFGLRAKESHYTALLMGTGLTFGTIVSLVGLNNHIITQNQYTILVSVVILSAVLPTILAQKYFTPQIRSPRLRGKVREGKPVRQQSDLVEEPE